jgi:hypothetical protein
VIGAELATAAITAVVVAVAARGYIESTGATVVMWWPAALAVRSTCVSIGGRLGAARPLSLIVISLHLLVLGLTIAVTLTTGSIAATIAVSTVGYALVAVFVSLAASQLGDMTDPPVVAFAWGTWLSQIAEEIPLPLAVMWFGLAIAAPLSALPLVGSVFWIPCQIALGPDKLSPAWRGILAPVFALGFGLAVHQLGPVLYHRLFAVLPPHPEWFAALAWCGVLLIPLGLGWSLPRSQPWRAATALVAVAIPVAAAHGGLAGLVLAAAIARCMRWRPDAPDGSGEVTAA